MGDKALGQGQGTIADIDRQPPRALRVHRAPDPLGRPLQARAGLNRAARAVLHRAEPGKKCIELPLLAPHIVPDVSGEGRQLLRRCDEPPQHGMRGHRTPPRRPPAPHACGQARADAHDERDGGALARQDHTEA